MAQLELTAEAVGKLSEKERHVLGCICINQDAGHAQRTLNSLMRKGWIVSYDEPFAGNPPSTTKRYEPSCPAAHMAWCEWCGANVTDEDIAAEDAETRAK